MTDGIAEAHVQGDPVPTSGIWRNVNETAYHADRNSLSHSGAKLILRAPALFRYRQDHPEHKAAFDFGHAAHSLVLGVGAELVVFEFDADKIKSPKSTKAWKEQQAEVRASGGVLLLPEEYDRVRAMADVLSTHRLAMRLLSNGQPEVSAYMEDPDTGVVLRGRADWLGDTIITDYKTARSSQPDEFVRSAANYSYHGQAAWYLDLFGALGHPAKAFAHIVQEVDPPHLVTVVELPEDLVEVGRENNRRAIERFRDCIESGKWPGYIPDTEFARPVAPAWALRTQGEAA